MKRLVTVLVGATVLAGLTSSIDALTTDYQAAVSIPQLEARCRTRDVQACNAHRAAVLAKFKVGKTSPATSDTSRECDAVSTDACRALALKAQTAKDRERALHLYGRNCFRRDLDSCGELGVMWLDDGVQPYARAGRVYLEEVCDAGSARHCYALASRFESGQGIPKDASEGAWRMWQACNYATSPADDQLKSVACRK